LNTDAHRVARSRAVAFVLGWQIWLGPLLSIALGALDGALDDSRYRLADPAVLHVAIVVVASLVGGYASGGVSALIAAALLYTVHARPDGMVQPLHFLAMVVAVAVFGTAGQLLRRSAHRRLRRAAAMRVLEYYRSLLVDLGAVVWEFDVDEERVTAVSDSCTRVLGYTPQQMMGDPELWRTSQHPDDLSITLPLNERLRARGSGEEVFEHRMIRPDGQTVWLQTALRAARDPSGHVVIRGVALDVSEHKHAQVELRNALSMLTATLDATRDGILAVDLEGRIASCNRRFVEMWQIPEDVMRSGLDARALEYATPLLTEPDAFLSKIRELYRNREATSFDVIDFKDGRVFERYSRPQLIGDQYVGRVWSFRDVTERVRAERALRTSEEQLRQAQKMEAVGQLAGGVAHDFNNILTAVLGNLSLILEDAAVPAIARQRAEEIQLAAERATNLTRQLLAFGRRQMLAPRVEYLSVVVLEMLKLLRLSVGEGVGIDLDLAPDQCPVLVDRGQIEQVILNLVINSRDAMPGGGRITISTRICEPQAARPSEAAASGGRQVVLSVTDTGEGMDAATQARIFEPFFTTKDRGRGTGLGLATAYGIVQQSGGSIHVRSAPGSGATFDIHLPYSEAVPESSADANGSHRAGNVVETVLVVEDEPQLRGLMREALARAGYRVIEAPNGNDAIEITGLLPGELDMLVTDFVMAGMDGTDLKARLKALRPNLSVLYVSGYPHSGMPRDRVLPPEASLLRKPFTMDELVRRVREVLDASPSALP
jgi:two-component system cell cycle sensor histidine kinase/response regulator CckA